MWRIFRPSTKRQTRSETVKCISTHSQCILKRWQCYPMEPKNAVKWYQGRKCLITVVNWYQGRKCLITVVKWYQGRKCSITVVKWYQGRKCSITVVKWYQGRKCSITVVEWYKGRKCHITNRKMISRWKITMVGWLTFWIGHTTLNILLYEAAI